MFITIFAFATLFYLLRYYKLTAAIVAIISQELWVYAAIAVIAILIQISIWVYKVWPRLRRVYHSILKWSDKEEILENLQSPSVRNSSNVMKRQYSTSAVPLKSGISNKPTKTRLNIREKLDHRSQISEPLNLLSLLKTKYVVRERLIALTNKVGTALRIPLAFNNMLAYGRVGRLSNGITKTKDFILYVLKLRKDHGAEFTIQWVKACHVATSKCLGENKLLSLRSLNPDLPLPRLTNGLPRCIPYSDRVLIRRGHVPTIRFWLGLFNLYRVLKVKGIVKTSTITGKFSGSCNVLRHACKSAASYNPFRLLKGSGFPILPSELAPKNFHFSLAASPSNKVSLYGILSDINLLKVDSPRLYGYLLSYLNKVKSHSFLEQIQKLEALNEVFKKYSGWEDAGASKSWTSLKGEPIFTANALPLKSALVSHGIPEGGLGVSQFATKDEPAGKVRLFALVDNVTQSVLKPLHLILFNILKSIPNDGTFNQDRAVERCMEKAVRSNSAFSFDLTAATDRLPVLLSQYILGNILRDKSLARLWKQILTYRSFVFLGPTAKKYKLDENTQYRYAVGQPMGALSSWAMLAITHHWILQEASRQINMANNLNSKLVWNEDYEILGDDLVIFNSALADKYLEIMSGLGCEINLTKSIVSKRRPVFEFAKRVCWSYAIVSGISLGQITAAWNVGARVANALSFAKAGLLENSVSLLNATLSRNAFLSGSAVGPLNTNSVRDQKAISVGMLALLGGFYQKGIFSLKEVMRVTMYPVHPSIQLLKRYAIAIPIQFTSHLAYMLLVELARFENFSVNSLYHTEKVKDLLPSNYKERDFNFENIIEPHLLALSKKRLEHSAEWFIHLWKTQIRNFRSLFINEWRYKTIQGLGTGEIVPVGDMPMELADAYKELELFIRSLFEKEGAGERDMALLLFDFQTKAYPSFEFIRLLQEKVDRLVQLMKIHTGDKPKSVIFETANQIRSLNDIWQLDYLGTGSKDKYIPTLGDLMMPVGPTEIPKPAVVKKPGPPLPGENGPYTPHWEGYPLYY